ncbi:MAG: ankyrin repeat domain-containing protein [Acidobacteriota bacterium]
MLNTRCAQPLGPYLAGLVLFALFAVPAQAAAGDQPPQDVTASDSTPFVLGGIQTHELDHRRWTAALHQAGMNAVQVTAYAHQGPWSTSKLWYHEEEPAVLREIRTARRNGLQVVLVLRVALDHNEPENRFLWHGLTYPATESATAEWFKTYTAFVVKWARIAAAEGVEVLGVASEMNSLAATLPVEEIPGLPDYYLDDEAQARLRNLVKRSEHLFTEDVRRNLGAGDFEVLDDFLVERNQAERRWARVFTFDDGERTSEQRVDLMNARRRLLESHWRALIDEVRRVYPGRLTLAANFDNYHEVSFWDALDQIGINAYFPLRATLETPLSVDGLAEAWREIFADVDAFRGTHGLRQPVLLTELGYTQRQGVSVAPWSSKGFIPLWDPEGETDRDRAFFWDAQPFVPKERAMALEALHRAYRAGHADLAGVLYWKLSSVSALARFEPFMLYLGVDATDPAYDALRLFADGLHPLPPRSPGDDRYLQAVDAIVRGDAEGLRGLLDGGVPSAPKGQSPLLHLATRLGHVEIASRLLDAGAGRGEADAAGLLPLHWACYQPSPAMVDLLPPPEGTSWRDGDGETPMMKCARLDNVDVARRLLERGDALDAVNDREETALHLAADQATLKTVRLLLDGGGDVDAADLDGQTPLHVAAERGDAAIVRALAKDSKGLPDGNGNLPAHYAAYFGQAEAFRILFDPEAVFRVNADGRNMLHLAAHGGSLEILNTVLPHFPTVDGTDSGGWTPLFHAIEASRVPAVVRLLEAGAAQGHRAADGMTALHRAAKGWEARTVKRILESRGAEGTVNLQDPDGNTPLHHAAGWGRTENIHYLLAAGADPALKNAEGDTPYDVAHDAERRRAALALGRDQSYRRLGLNR